MGSGKILRRELLDFGKRVWIHLIYILGGYETQANIWEPAGALSSYGSGHYTETAKLSHVPWLELSACSDLGWGQILKRLSGKSLSLLFISHFIAGFVMWSILKKNSSLFTNQNYACFIEIVAMVLQLENECSSRRSPPKHTQHFRVPVTYGTWRSD